MIGSLIDITERKKAEEQRELLIHELNHRVKNTLATVQSLAAQTMRSAASLADFTGAFEARLFALSKTHNLLTEGAWAGASLRALLEVEVAPYAQDGEAGRFSLAGLHDVHLAARAAVALGLAFHELATNAVKYGALSNETGSVSVMWTLENAAREQQLLLHLIWTEQGGPPVEKPRRRGFGTRLIERGITLELGRRGRARAPAGGPALRDACSARHADDGVRAGAVMGTPPLQNRVTPFGELVATPARGLLLGNRGGRFHDPATRALRTRRWASKQWICCVLAFKGWHREVWKTGYTELFFLDEVTALAAGHRPCCECRRVAARGFQAALVAAGMTPLSLDEIDARLDAERRDGRAKRLHRRPVSRAARRRDDRARVGRVRDSWCDDPAVDARGLWRAETAAGWRGRGLDAAADARRRSTAATRRYGIRARPVADRAGIDGIRSVAETEHSARAGLSRLFRAGRG